MKAIILIRRDDDHVATVDNQGVWLFTDNKDDELTKAIACAQKAIADLEVPDATE